MALSDTLRRPAALHAWTRPERDAGRGWVAAGAGTVALGLTAYSVDARLGLVVAGLAAAPLLLVAPVWGLLLVVAVVPFDAVAGILSGRAFTLTRLIGMGALGAFAAHALLLRRPIRLGRPGMLLAAYVGFAAVSVWWAADLAMAVRGVRTLAQLLLLYVVAVNLLDRRGVLLALDVLLGATVLLAFVVLWQLPAAGSARARLVLGDETFDPNYLAATLVFPAIAAIARSGLGGPGRWLRLAAVVPIGIALFATGSRGGGSALVVGVIVLGVLRPGLAPRVASAMLATALLLPSVLPERAVSRIVERWAASTEDHLSGRTDIWRVGVAMIADQPLAGTGFGGFREAFYRYMVDVPVDPEFAHAHSRGNRAAHNIYVGTVAELGVLGGGLLFAALALHGVTAWRAARAHPELVALPAMFGCLVFFGGSIDLMLQKLPWLLLGFVAAPGVAAASGGEGA